MENIQSLIESTKYTALAPSDAGSMTMMLENTEKEHARLISEGTLSGDVAQFTPILMPMVRRVYPNLIANELLGVQPMAMPTGFIYALTNQYTGDSGTNKQGAFGSMIIETAVTALAAGTTITGGTSGATGTVLYSEGFKALVSLGSAVRFAPAEVIAEDIGEGITTTTVDATFTNEASFGRILKNYTGPVNTATAEALSTDMKEIGFNISKKSVEAKSRALKGQYSVEMYQDLKAQHGLLADEEIMSLMSYEMQAEIDREVVDFVNSNATQLADTVFTTDATDGGRWEIESYRAQAVRISKEAAIIGINTKRGQGNVIVASPKFATMLEQVGTFKTATQESNVKTPTSGGVARTFDGRFKVIVDQYAVSDYATVMYKGQDRRDAMGFFAPYVPMSFTKVTHADSGQPAVIAKTRYALATTPGVESATSNDRAAAYARSFGVDFTNTVLA
jgi:hypothetical protein